MTAAIGSENPVSAEVSEVRSIGSKMGVGISSFGSLMLGVGSMIGSMAWLIHSTMLAKAGPLASITAWVIGGLMTLPLALIVAELASMFPAAGGPYVYKYYAFKRLVPGAGELLGFLTGWLFWICLMTGLACMSNGLANLLSGAIYGSASASPIWFGPVVIVALWIVTTVLNLMPVTRATGVNSYFTLLKFAMAAGFGALAFLCPQGSVVNIFLPASGAGGTDFVTNVASVLMLAVAGFGGVEISACTSSETRDPQRTVPRNVILTLVLVAAIYIGMCAAISYVTPFSVSPDKATAIVAGTSFQATCPSLAGYLAGSAAGALMTFAVVASIVGCGFGLLLSSARIGYSMSETGLFPRAFSRLDGKTRVPSNMLLCQLVVLCLLGVGTNLLTRSGLFPDAYAFLGEVFGFLYSFLAILYGVCLVSLRYTDPQLERPFRLGGNGNSVAWILSALSVFVYSFAAFFCTGMLHQLAGYFLLALGIPVYWLNGKHRERETVNARHTRTQNYATPRCAAVRERRNAGL